MRVTHVITRLIVGGAQENTVASVLGLHSKPGLDVDLISGPATGREGSLENCFAGHPCRLTILPELVRPVNPWNDFHALRRLTEIFRRTRPDIVEIDVNPLMVHAEGQGATALDALIVTAAKEG